MNRLFRVVLMTVNNRPLIPFSLAIVARGFLVKPTFRVSALLFVIAIMLLKKVLTMTSFIFAEVYFRHGAVKRFVGRSDRYRLRPWPDNDPTLLESVAPQLEGFLKIVSLSIAQWKSRGRINDDFKPVMVYTAELKTREFPPALRSYPSYMGPSVIVYTIRARSVSASLMRDFFCSMSMGIWVSTASRIDSRTSSTPFLCFRSCCSSR